VVVLVVDSSVAPTGPEERLDGRRVVVALNKSDLPRAWSEDDVAALAKCFPVVELSAKEGRGLADLRSLVVDSVAGVPAEGTPILTRSRQRDALEKALDCLTRAYEAFTQRVPADLVAVDVQAALDHIGSVTGSVTNEDVLDVVFRDFCIGK
jgi:tRNA modification GTPase